MLFDPSEHPLEKLLVTYQLDLRPVLTPKFIRLGGSDLNPQGYFEYTIEKWDCSCWPRKIKAVYGATPREAVENLLKEI
jgi:hypothetical protein